MGKEKRVGVGVSCSDGRGGETQGSGLLLAHLSTGQGRDRYWGVGGGARKKVGGYITDFFTALGNNLHVGRLQFITENGVALEYWRGREEEGSSSLFGWDLNDIY